MDMIGEYVSNRGLEEVGVKSLRRPRTCFYTSDYPELETQWADQVWQVAGGSLEKLAGHRCLRDEKGHVKETFDLHDISPTASQSQIHLSFRRSATADQKALEGKANTK